MPNSLTYMYCTRSIRHHGYQLFISLPEFLCGIYLRVATIREQRLLIPIAAREAEKWSIKLTPLLMQQVSYNLLQQTAKYLSCTSHRERVARQAHVLTGVAWLYDSRVATISFSTSGGAATNQEQHLIERIRYKLLPSNNPNHRQENLHDSLLRFT